MGTWVGIEQLKLSEARLPGPLPTVPARLLELVRQHGPVNPVVVRPLGGEDYEIISNVETWLAVQKAGQHRVPIEVREDIGADEAAEVVQHTSAPQDLDPIEEATLFVEQMEEFGGRDSRGAVTRLADEEGLSRTYVSHALRLLELPECIQQMVRRGELKPGHARPLVSIGDRKKQIRLAERTILHKLSVREIEDLARERRSDLQSSETLSNSAPTSDPDTERLETQITETIGCPARIDTEQGLLVIEYCGDLDVLQGVLARLGCDEN